MADAGRSDLRNKAAKPNVKTSKFDFHRIVGVPLAFQSCGEIVAFTMDGHTKLWKRLGAKDPKKGFGVVAVGNLWGWYETWVKEVRKECEAHPELYGRAPAPAPTLVASVTTDVAPVTAA